MATCCAGGSLGQVTLPFFLNDVPGTATTQAKIGVFTSGTGTSQTTNEWKAQANVHVVGLSVVSDDARTAGTATVRVRVSGAGTAFNGGSVVVDGTNTTSDSDMVAPASGVAVAAGQTIGVEVVTAGWTPTTANLALFLVLSYD